MRAPDGRPRGDDNMRSVVRGLKNTDDILARRLSRQPKIPEPAAAASIVDVASINTTGFPGLPWSSGSFDMNGAVTYGSAFSQKDDAAIDWLSVASGNIAPTEDGWYQAWCKVLLIWNSQADAPGASVSIYLNGRNTPSSPMFPIISRGSKWGVEAYITNGPEWMTTSNYWRVEADGIAASSGAIFNSSAAWRITKYGSA